MPTMNFILVGIVMLSDRAAGSPSTGSNDKMMTVICGKFFTVDEIDAHNDDDSRFTSMGDYTTEEAKEYFDSVHFEISDKKWRHMGCRDQHRPAK